MPRPTTRKRPRRRPRSPTTWIGCGCGSRRPRCATSSTGRAGWWRRAGRRARCAGSRSTPPATSAPATMAITGADALALLREGEMEIEGRLVEASNITLRVQLADRVRAVYKPIRGERPLWDFPAGSLAGREVAAYELSRALGWELVPPTVMRDGPLGPGSCQLWLDELVDPPVGFVAAQELPSDWLPVASARDE